ncbi:hypothetical protein [Arthrobacter sp. ISL-95]|uniref:hypothetical protein n=1 Tax=Arthrobacter sp. ISL-95 TaxID=2819116 RepID=UPI001BEBD3CD|nr:hypothetical protein [Arthrobacter sp. ISL-95]MBT2585796.1 hypothetical protein [Arthrobacter sp. ISL-95]
MFFLGPVAAAIIVYLFLRMQVWSKPDAQSVASHGLWVGIIGWMASSLQGAMSAGIIRANPMGSSAPATPDQIANALAWPIVASLGVHALGQLSYPAPKAPSRYAELKIRRIGDFLPRKLAWTTAAIFGYAALAIAWIATLPGHSSVLPTPPGQAPPMDNGYMDQGQDGRIQGSELALWLGGALIVLALGTWLVLLLIARRRQLETLDGDDNRTLRTIATNRLLRTVATIAAGLATIAGNFASQPAPGAAWQSSWFNVLGLINMAVLAAMWWWRVPELPSILKAPQATSAKTLRSDPLTHGAARLSISLGAVLGVVGGLALVAGVVAILVASHPLNPWAFPTVTAFAAAALLIVIAAGEMLLARNYGLPEAQVHWPRQPVSRGLLSFAIGSALIFAVAVAFAVAAEAQPFAPRTWPAALVLSAVVAASAAAAIIAVRRRRGIPESEGEAGLDAALRAISLYRIVRTLAAYCLGQAAALLLITGDAWYSVFSPGSGEYPLAPSPANTVGMVLAAIAVIVAVIPVRSLLATIPRAEPANLGERAQ